MGYHAGQTLYRASLCCGSDYVTYDEYVVTEPTAKGGWIKSADRGTLLGPPVDRKWVPLDARFCSPTKEEALQRLKARTRSYVRHARRALHEAERRAALLDTGVVETPLLRTFDWWA